MGDVSPSGRYRIEVKADGDAGRITIRDTRSGKAIWTRASVDPSNVQARWSSRADLLALHECRDAAGNRLVVWQPNAARVTTGAFLRGEPALDLVFSPDGRKLLLRIAASMGDADINLGALWCLDLRSGQTQRLSRWARRPAWMSATRARFVEVTPVASDVNADPDTWPATERTLDCR